MHKFPLTLPLFIVGQAIQILKDPLVNASFKQPYYNLIKYILTFILG